MQIKALKLIDTTFSHVFFNNCRYWDIHILLKEQQFNPIGNLAILSVYLLNL